ncbi:MAG: DUF4293 family protein [Saprospiraceae bacterium]|nr:DUF4293 family protein [Saprospiraceae bacterium]
MIQRIQTVFLMIAAVALGTQVATPNISNAAITPGIGAFMPVIAMIALIFAYRGITKDDKIVKSMDRLR